MMNLNDGRITVFPTEAALRRYEYRLVLEKGVLDASRLTTQKKMLAVCERAARIEGLLSGQTLSAAGLRLLLEEACSAVSFVSGQPIAGLSLSARAKTLQSIIDRFSVFAENESDLTGWLLAHAPTHKLHGAGQLLSAWRALCKTRKIADRFTVNRALLRLIGSGSLPPSLQNGLRFCAVRWLNPFEEQFVIALKQRLGADRVEIHSALPAAHAEAAEDRLCALVHSELMRGAEEEWKPWLEDFADAFETDDGNLLGSESKDRVSFFVAAHPYGEIEDTARRIAREIETGTQPDDIAVIVRNLSPYTDIIPDVFERFGIPFYSRRGMPAPAHPPVKTLLAFLSFSQTFSRDRLCDLLLLPGLRWNGLSEPDRLALVREIRLKEPPVLRRLPKELAAFESLCDRRVRPAASSAQKKAKSSVPYCFSPAEFATHVRGVIAQHNLNLPDEVLALLDEIEAVQSEPRTMERWIVLFEQLLDGTNLKKESGTESGVYVINAMDAAGLKFKSVFAAGMDDRTFPQRPVCDPLLDRTERNALQAFLKTKGIPSPRLALPDTGAALIQEEILFLTAIGAARERLTLSYARFDAAGKECAPGGFFERMRGLTGLAAPDLGTSFHTILPPELCRAEDEVRQTRAALTRKTGSETSADVSLARSSDSSRIQKLISEWLEDHPEFSATALESLARNRLVFFLEKVIGIRPERTHEDPTDPLDRGTVIHDILEKFYTAAALQSGIYAVPEQTAESSFFRWHLSRTAGESAIPLAVFSPERESDWLVLAEETAQSEFKKAERRPSRRLGHPAVWETEKRKILRIIENIIRTDLQTALTENRYPALFEMKFDRVHRLPLTLKHGDEQIALKGKLDRIDLIFNPDGELDRLLVIDYKGKSRNDTLSDLEKKIALNLDCQMPVYIFAAQQRFFGTHNTPELNEKTRAVYHLQTRNFKGMMDQFGGKRLGMSPELADAFLTALFSSVRKLRAGDLGAEPLIAGYEDWSHICRTRAVDWKNLPENAGLPGPGS